MATIATSGGEIATSGAAAVLFAGIAYMVMRYVAQPWAFFSSPDIAKRMYLGVIGLLFCGGVLAVLIGTIKVLAE